MRLVRPSVPYELFTRENHRDDKTKKNGVNVPTTSVISRERNKAKVSGKQVLKASRKYEQIKRIPHHNR